MTTDEEVDLGFPDHFGSQGPLTVLHGENGATVVLLFVSERPGVDGIELAKEQALTLERIAASMRKSIAELSAMSHGGES